MLSGRANSNTHCNFEKCYEEFLVGKATELFISCQHIVSLLHTYSELAMIAPAYVLGIFQKDTTKIYSGWVASKRSKKIEITAFSRAKPKIKDKSDNSVVNQEIQLIIYQFLCTFFGQVIYIDYDQAICDYILQTFMPLIGLKYFDVDQEKVRKVACSGSCINKDAFVETDIWVHPLLGEIEKRISSSLYLYPESIPKISFTNRKSPLEKAWGEDAEKLVDDTFVNEYLRIFVIPSGGIGCPRILEDIREPLANLMDQTIEKSSKRQIQQHLQQPESLKPETLLAYENGFHRACAQKIYDDYHTKLLLFLYDYLQSKAFSCGKRIPTAEECRNAMQQGIKLWTCADMPAPPEQDTNYRPNKLNIINRK